MNDTLRYAVVLGLIGCVAAFVLAFTYNKTKAPIAIAQKNIFLNGLSVVLPEFDNDPLNDSLNVDGRTVYVAMKDGEITGYAVESLSSLGYGGDISVLVGVEPNGDIYNLTVLKHKETPGLGDRVTQKTFTDQFKGADINSGFAVRKDGGQIDQFSGATISPRAVTDAVNRSSAILKKVLAGEI